MYVRRGGRAVDGVRAGEGEGAARARAQTGGRAASWAAGEVRV
jgi:hypothetical protein